MESHHLVKFTEMVTECHGLAEETFAQEVEESKLRIKDMNWKE
jgi:hypothetical protein